MGIGLAGWWYIDLHGNRASWLVVYGNRVSCMAGGILTYMGIGLTGWWCIDLHGNRAS